MDPLRYAHYRVLQRADGTPWRLGMGAMGMTYKARDERLNIDVALKLILPNRTTDARTQSLFLREARSAARVRHANVASVMFLGDTPGELFYAMEYVAGDSLQKFLAARGRLPVPLALDLAIQIALGLGAIHAEGIIHRDLKPGNIMLIPARVGGVVQADAWEVKIIDFGLARGFEGQAGDNTIGFRGTVLYASPEQCQEWTDLDGRSDLYALGCVLWEMLLGGPPFQAKTQRDIMNLHVMRPPPLDRLSELPKPVQTVLAKLLSKDREARYPTAAITAHALQKARAGEVPPSGIAPLPRPEPGEEIGPPTQMIPAAAPVRPASPVVPAPRRPWLAWAAGLALLACGGAAYWTTRRPAEGPGATAASVTAPAIEKSVAVLPFESLGEDKQSQFFTAGVQDEILTDLARVADLKVISRSSVRQYVAGAARDLPQLGKALDVAYVVEGSVRCVGERVRVLVQLVDTRNGKTRWAERYDRALADVFSIQAEIAAAVAEKLKAILTPAERAAMATKPTTELRAWELYLMAKELVFSSTSGRGPEGARALREAETLLGQTIERDPKFFHAHCLLAYVHDSIFWFGIDATPKRLVLAEAAIGAAENLRPGAGELHFAKAFHAYRANRDYKLASAEIARANALLPNDRAGFSLRGYLDRRQGRFEDAIRNLEKASALSPREVTPAYDLAESYAASRRAADFLRVMDRLAELSPEELRIQVYRAYGGHLMLQGNPAPLRELLASYQRDRPQQFKEYAPHAFALAILRRDAELAAEAAAALPEEFTVWNRRRLPRAWFDGVRHALFGAKADAQVAFARAQIVLSGWLQKSPEDDRAWMGQALLQAHLGQKEEALRSARRALALVPRENDAIDGANHAAGLAEVLAILGEKEQALAELERLAEVPFVFDHGDLLLNPIWDGLRGDVRFASVLQRTQAR